MSAAKKAAGKGVKFAPEPEPEPAMDDVLALGGDAVRGGVGVSLCVRESLFSS